MTFQLRQVHAGLPSSGVSAIRPEIQALRAIAVLGVVVFHLWPHRVSGGYIGVDVFFVVSGFLITDHLLREISHSGVISLPRFWARRARRLLPASLLVLAFSAVGVWLLVPDIKWTQFGGEIISSIFYVENWALAAQSVDYMALTNAKSPVQHFWSLGVEEQFYVVWPILLIIALFFARRHGVRLRRAIAATIITITIASLAYSVWDTAMVPSAAYFSTFTRAWEFGVGGALALLLQVRASPFGGLARWMAWTGLAALAVSMFTFTGQTPFPSYTALLPVLATTVVIAAGAPSGRCSPTPLYRMMPVQFIGDISYGVYLWHWPLIVLFTFATKRSLSIPVAVGALFASLVLGWASKKFVEDPIRTSRFLARARPRRTFVAVGVATVVLAVMVTPLATHKITAPTPVPAAQQSACYGARSVSDSACGDPESVPLVAPLSSFALDLPSAQILGCENSVASGDVRRCDYGDPSASGPHVALVGDSHATRLVEPLQETIVGERSGRLSTFTVSGCSMVSGDVTGSAWGFDPAYASQCQAITAHALQMVAGDSGISTVLLTNRTRLYVSDDAAFHPLTAQMIEETIRMLVSAGKRVIVIKDPPETHASAERGAPGAVDCLLAASSASDCSLPRTQAMFDDPMSKAAAATATPVIDLDDIFCTEDRCRSQIGGLVVYSDDSHLSRSFASSLVPALSARFETTDLSPRPLR